MFERIIVALDGSPLAEQVLPHVEALGTRYGSQLILIQAIKISRLRAIGSAVSTPAGPGPLVDRSASLLDEQLEAAEYLAPLADRLRAKGLSVDFETPEGAPADALVAAATPSDLIALTTHGRTGLRRAVVGSVAQDVLRKASCPVLAIRVSEGSKGDS
jgi:nucleotide-binding universal stress UspA family protein